MTPKEQILLDTVSRLDNDGELTFGGYGNSVMSSLLNYVLLTTTFPRRFLGHRPASPSW